MSSQGCLEPYCPRACVQSSVGTLGEGEGSWHVPIPRGCSALGPWVPLGISDPLSPHRQCKASGRQASPAAAAQAASTCEKFVKGDERKGEEGVADGCEHLARQSRQLPPRHGILSSAVLSGPSPIPPLTPSPTLQGGAWPGMEVGGGSCWLLHAGTSGRMPGAGPASKPLKARPSCLVGEK